MLRLTLRTLLAYLDDTLEPAQAKDIGKKVAESEFAQQTVERIKTVTRRRRLTAPPVLADDHSTDPNSIAEYLDNVLPADQVAELEQSALDNDVRLAEVAACHQILTLVLGEPARVPPTARRRMYRLVKGPESLPYRQTETGSAPVAGVAAPAEVDEFQEHEDDLLTTFLGPHRLMWLLGLLIAVGLLVIAVWLAIPPAPSEAPTGYIAAAPANLGSGSKPPVLVKKTHPPTDKKVDPVPTPQPHEENEIGPPPRVLGAGAAPVRPVDSERRVVANCDTPTQPLLFLKRDTVRWERADPNEARIHSTDLLVALPGFHPELLLETGVRIVCWGNSAELLSASIEATRLALYVPAAGIDADLALFGGRLFISAPKATRPVVVRVRIHEEVWDITLHSPDTEVALDVMGETAPMSFPNREQPETPRAIVYLGVLQGVASLRNGFQQSGELLGGAKWKWDSKLGRPGPAPKDDADEAGIANRWSKAVPATPAAKDMSAAVAEMARRVSLGQGPFDVDFYATLKDPREAAGRRVLATRMLGAIDSLSYLIEALELDSAIVRDAAARTLRHWLAQDANHDAALAQALAMKVTFTDNQRELVAALSRSLERPPAAMVVDQLFDLLGNEKLAVRELARMQLATLDPAGAKESNYDAMSERRGGQMALWKSNWKKRNK